ncbi:MAG: TlpA disulfide reductase family protein [Acidobacteriaceae bacterium]
MSTASDDAPGNPDHPGPADPSSPAVPADFADPSPVDPGASAPPPSVDPAAEIHPLASPAAVSAIDRLTSIALDFAVGFGALFLLGIFLLLAMILHARSYFPLAAFLFFAVAMARAVWSRMNPWIEGLAISIGASTPVALVALAVGARPLRVGAAVLGFALLCGAGSQTTRFLRTRRATPAAATVLAIVVLVLLAAKYLPIPALPTPGMRTMDKPAPALTLSMLDGAPVSLPSLKGRVIVLDFWGTWCGPCMAEMPAVLKVHRRYQSNKEVVFFAVNTGWEDDTADKVRDTVKQKHMDIPIAFDTAASKIFGVQALPTLIVIDRRGHIRVENTGYSETEPLDTDLAKQIDALLQAPAQ